MRNQLTSCFKLLIILHIFIKICSGNHKYHHHGRRSHHHHGSSSVTPLFGFGVGYKKVSTYVPVLTFQTRKKKPQYSGTDVVFVNQPNIGGGGPTVTITGNDQDEDQGGENDIGSIGTSSSNTDSGQNVQQQGNNGGVSVQYHNLRSDDGETKQRDILHRNRHYKYDERHQFHEDEDSQYHTRSNYKNGKNANSRRNEIRDYTTQNHKMRYNGFERHKNNEDMDSEESSEMNEYTIGDLNWDSWKPKGGNRNIFNGFNRFFGNNPRSYY